MAKRESKLIKICLESRGEDSESAWAEDLGPAKTGAKGSRKVRLVNVPFMHAKPTWGDVIVVSPVDDGLLTWDSNNVPWKKIGTRILEDSGRYAMIVNYTPPKSDPSGNTAFKALDKTSAKHNIVCEGCYGPEDGKPGCAYLAVPDELEPEEVMAALAGVPATLVQIHPELPKKKKPAKQPVTKATKTGAKPKKPAAKKSAAKTSAAKKPAAKKPAAKKNADKPAKKQAKRRSKK